MLHRPAEGRRTADCGLSVQVRGWQIGASVQVEATGAPSTWIAPHPVQVWAVDEGASVAAAVRPTAATRPGKPRRRTWTILPVTPGQAHESKGFEPLVNTVRIPQPIGRPRTRRGDGGSSGRRLTASAFSGR